MVDTLIPQAIRLKARFDKPPRLIDDYEIAAAIGLAFRDAGRALPEEEKLSVLRESFLADGSFDEKLRNLVNTRLADDIRADWRRLMEIGYHYQG